jgi:hypothetical protein
MELVINYPIQNDDSISLYSNQINITCMAGNKSDVYNKNNF